MYQTSKKHMLFGFNSIPVKNAIRDRGNTALEAAYTVDTVDMIDMVCTVNMVFTVDMVYTVGWDRWVLPQIMGSGSSTTYTIYTAYTIKTSYTACFYTMYEQAIIF